jgi:hypothetical protein
MLSWRPRITARITHSNGILRANTTRPHRRDQPNATPVFENSHAPTITMSLSLTNISAADGLTVDGRDDGFQTSHWRPVMSSAALLLHCRRVLHLDRADRRRAEKAFAGRRKTIARTSLSFFALRPGLGSSSYISRALSELPVRPVDRQHRDVASLFVA